MPNSGSLVSAPRSRARSLESYYLDPQRCVHCQAVIVVPENHRASDLRKRKFCGSSCAAKFNNKLPRKRGPEKRRVSRQCRTCAAPFEVISSSRKRYCSLRCRMVAPTAARKVIEGISKGELFASRASWQAARSVIQDDARRKFVAANPAASCAVCGYVTHVEVCHRKPVASFEDSATVAEINRLNNLVGLCPNHHWEFDHGIMKLHEENMKPK